MILWKIGECKQFILFVTLIVSQISAPIVVYYNLQKFQQITV